MATNKPEYLIVHHTGGTEANPFFDTSHHTMETIDAYHKSLGWDGIGYNWFIEKDGKIRKGRSEEKIGAHTKGYNDKSVGVCLAGNFDATIPTLEQIKSLIVVMNDIKNRYKIPIEKIVPHREFANKTCYGRRLADDWAQSLLAPITQKDIILVKVDELRKMIEML